MYRMNKSTNAEETQKGNFCFVLFAVLGVGRVTLLPTLLDCLTPLSDASDGKDICACEGHRV